MFRFILIFGMALLWLDSPAFPKPKAKPKAKAKPPGDPRIVASGREA